MILVNKYPKIAQIKRCEKYIFKVMLYGFVHFGGHLVDAHGIPIEKRLVCPSSQPQY